MPILEKVEDGYLVHWVKCEKCGGPMDEMQKPHDAMNYQCLVCGHKAKVTLKKKVVEK